VLKVGMGYDTHRLESGRRMVVGGVEIPHDKGPVGHSDGDILIHAIIDAILGACSLGDIGSHFPDDDPQYKDISSLELLTRIQEKIVKIGRVEHIDSIVVAERPKLAPHIDAMREAIAGVLNITVDKVSIKAKTAEGIGSVGKEEGLEAYAIAMVDL
jgi:2-C-methyl-D-erythritol 2,4-cyclodiphosphate synthase